MADKTSKTLELLFRNQAGAEIVINVAGPADDVTHAKAKAVMTDIITKNLFSTKGGDLTTIVDARIRDLSVVSLT